MKDRTFLLLVAAVLLFCLGAVTAIIATGSGRDGSRIDNEDAGATPASSPRDEPSSMAPAECARDDSAFDKPMHIDTSPSLQRDRQDFIQKLKQLGLITKTERPAKYPRVYVTQTFMGTDVDAKRSFLGVIFAYYYAGQDVGCLDQLILRDSRTGKDLGTFNGLGVLTIK